MRSVVGISDFKRGKGNDVVFQRAGARIFLSLLFFSVCFCANHPAVAAASIAETMATDSSLSLSLVEDHFVTVESVRVHYIDTGTRQPLVMIHGNAGSVADFEFGALDLLSSEYRVIAVDRPGHGGSDRPAGKTATVEFQAELLHGTLSSLGITQSTLVGHSWGAALALAYALKYPREVSALVLLAPAAYPDDGGNALVRAMVRTPGLNDVSLFLGRAILGRRLLRQALARAFYPQSLPDSYVRVANRLWLGQKQLKAYIEDESTLNASLKKMSKRYSEIAVPVVIVTGDKDQIVAPDQNARVLHAAIPQSQLIEIKDVGHEIPLTRPESIGTALGLISVSLAGTQSSIQPSEVGR